MALSFTSATSTGNFINTLGVNTHIDFTWTSYNNLTVVENSINYLGIKNLRDSANATADAGVNGLWQQVASATGAKFDAYMQEGSATQMAGSMAAVPQLAAQGILNFLEGGNEEDQSYAVSQGNSLANAAQYQQQVYAMGQKLGLPIINMSFGAGWGASSTGDYGTVGNLAAYANYANAHIYVGTGNPPLSAIQALDSDAQLAASRPVITTEFGYYTDDSTGDPSNVSVNVQAKYLLDGLLDAYQAGNVKTYLYELLDENPSGGSEGNFGLFYSNGTPKPAATAIHNLTTLLADPGGGFTPTGLSYSLSGTLATDHSLLLEKSDGSFWLALWNETRLSGPSSPTDISVPSHQVTLTLQNPASSVIVYDPLTGTTAVQSASQASSVSVALPDHPILVEIVPGTATSTSAVAAAPPVSAPPALTPQDLAVVVPSSASVTAGQTTAIAGVSISDAWAQSHAGNLALNIGVRSGAIEIDNGTTVMTGVAGQTLHLSGSLSQLNGDLASLRYVAQPSAGTDDLSVNVWNQAGVSTTQNLSIGVTVASTAGTPQDLAIVSPAAAATVTHGQTQVLTGVSISDAWAQSHSGNLALNIGVGSGSIAVSNGVSNLTATAGQTLHLTGTLAQLNADLASLDYSAPAASGTDTVTVNVWNQAGVSTTHGVVIDIL
jgi:hypothetical protein